MDISMLSFNTSMYQWEVPMSRGRSGRNYADHSVAVESSYEYAALVEAFRDDDLSKFRNILERPLSDPNAVYIKTLSSFGDSKWVTFLLSIIACDTRPNAPLFAEALLQDSRTLKHQKDQHGECAIHYAVKKRNVPLLEKLLEHGAKPNIFNRNGFTPLHLLFNQFKSRWTSDSEKIEKCFKILIENGADVNIVDKDNKTPMQYAISWMNKGAIELLVQHEYPHEKLSLRMDNGTIAEVTKICTSLQIPDASPNITVDASRLFQLLYSGNEKSFCKLFVELTITTGESLSEYDNGEYTFLQYACEHNMKNAAKLLVENGADIFFDWPDEKFSIINSPMASINRLRHINILRAILDVEHLPDETVKKAYEATMKAQFEDGVLEFLKRGLIPLHVLTNDDGTPTLAFKNISASTYESFLNSRISEGEENTNYEITLNYDFLNAIDDSTSIAHIDSISQMRHMKHILLHPILNSYICIKWTYLKILVYTYLQLHSAFCLLMSTYLVLNYLDLSDYNMILRIFLFILLAILSILEIIVFRMSKTVDKLRKVLKIIMLVFALYILIVNHEKLSERAENGHISSILILCSWIHLLLVIGLLPIFSSQIEMFKRVVLSYLEYLATYVVIIIAFSLSFFILFHPITHESDENVKSMFMNPFKSLFKTMIMMTGEFDSNEIPFHIYNLTSHVIFSLFILFIVLVLLNLLNGLAVADTKHIKDKADLYASMARLRLVLIAHATLSNVIVKRVVAVLINLFFLIKLFKKETADFKYHCMKANVSPESDSQLEVWYNNSAYIVKIPKSIFSSIVNNSITELLKSKNLLHDEERKMAEEKLIADVTEVRKLLESLNREIQAERMI